MASSSPSSLSLSSQSSMAIPSGESSLLSFYDLTQHPSLKRSLRHFDANNKRGSVHSLDIPAVVPMAGRSSSPSSGAQESFASSPRSSPRPSIISSLDEEINTRLMEPRLKGLSLPRSLSPRSASPVSLSSSVEKLSSSPSPGKVCFRQNTTMSAVSASVERHPDAGRHQAVGRATSLPIQGAGREAPRERSDEEEAAMKE